MKPTHDTSFKEPILLRLGMAGLVWHHVVEYKRSMPQLRQIRPPTVVLGQIQKNSRMFNLLVPNKFHCDDFDGMRHESILEGGCH